MSLPAPLAGANQVLTHAITFALPALESVWARITGETGALLADVICDLRAALTENGNPA